MGGAYSGGRTSHPGAGTALLSAAEVKGRDSSPALMISGLALPPATVGNCLDRR